MTQKILILGTAQWGWTVSKNEAFHLLDAWLNAGFRHIDGATNYPINRNPNDFRAAEHILQEYIQAHGLHDLKITHKIGSLDNMRSPDINLSPSFLQMVTEEYLRLFDSNLSCVMVHWDNRSEVPDIRASLEALQKLQLEHRIQAGLSGLAHPEAYAEANAPLGLSFEIQLKHNVLQSDLARYSPLRAATSAQEGHHFYAYGINVGGAKLDTPYPADSTFLTRGGEPEKVAAVLKSVADLLPEWNTAFVRPPVKTMNHIGLIYAGLDPAFNGIVLGVSSVAQLRETLDFWRNFEVFDYADVYAGLKKRLF